MAAGKFYERTASGVMNPLTVRGYRRDDGSYVPLGQAYDVDPNADTGSTDTTGRTSILFGASPGVTVGIPATEAAIGRIPLVRRYSNYNIPGAGSAERRKYYWHEERVQVLLNGTTTQTGAQVAATLVNNLPAGSYVTAGHENDNDSNLPAALRVLVTACLNRSDGGVRVAPIGRGFELRNTVNGATEQARVDAMVGRIMPTAAANADNTYFQMHRTHSATGKAVGCIGVDLYNGKNALDGTATTEATNGQELTPWQVYGPCALLGKTAQLPWMVGETAYMVGRYKISDPLFTRGNKTDAEMAAYWKECLGFWLNPATYYPDHRYPGCVPPEVMCYWYSYNGDVKPEPNNFILDGFPLTAAVWKDFLTKKSRL